MLVHQPFQQQQLFRQQSTGVAPCRATLDDQEISEFVKKWESMRPTPAANNEKLEKVFKMIDEINAKDPQQVNYKGQSYPYRVIYSTWVLEKVKECDPKASDELLILAKGRNIESWKLSEIRRDDYAPTGFGQRQWETDRKTWLMDRLGGVMKEAGYDEASVALVSDFMMQRNIPDPNDIRKSDLVGALGAVNYRLLELATMTQALRDADALVLLEHSFEQMFDFMKTEDILARMKRELARVSEKCTVKILSMRWNDVAKKIITKSLPAPRRFGYILKEIEGVSAASTHPGDWRYKDFDYE